MSFVFICIDRGTGRRLIVDRPQESGIPFIDVGIGWESSSGRTIGWEGSSQLPPALQTSETTSLAALHSPTAKQSMNIPRTSNALNAARAVIKWKKLCGYFDDVTNEHYCAYTIRSNQLISEDLHEA